MIDCLSASFRLRATCCPRHLLLRGPCWCVAPDLQRLGKEEAEVKAGGGARCRAGFGRVELDEGPATVAGSEEELKATASADVVRTRSGAVPATVARGQVVAVGARRSGRRSQEDIAASC